MFELKSNESLVFYEFPLLAKEEGIRQAVFTSKGGFDVGLHAKEAALKSRERIQKQLLVKKLIIPCQRHTDHIEPYPDSSPLLHEGCDAVMTQERGIGLLIQHADCQAALFYDRVKKCIAAVHCGWRGNVLKIYTKTIAALKKNYGSKAEDLLVAISPSLGPNHSEFIHMQTEFPEEFWRFSFKENYLNLWEMSKAELLENGVLEKNIEIASICTYSHPDLFYSYRRDKTQARNATVISLV